ncbi:hypothetical protein RYX36_022317, partial [Vicia faba]
FLEYQQKHVDTTKPTVMILRYAKVKEQGKFLIAVTNTYSVIKLQINEDITDINEFLKSTGKSLTTTNSNSRGWSQKTSSSQMSIREKFLDKSIHIKLHEISQLAEAGITDPLEFPLALDAMLGKKFTFKILESVGEDIKCELLNSVAVLLYPIYSIFYSTQIVNLGHHLIFKTLHTSPHVPDPATPKDNVKRMSP